MRVMLLTVCVSNSPPMYTWTAIAATFMRTASSMSTASNSFDSSFRMLGPPLARMTTPRVNVGVSHERNDVDVHAFEPGGRAKKVAVVDGEHHRAARRGVEDAGEPVLHA